MLELIRGIEVLDENIPHSLNNILNTKRHLSSLLDKGERRRGGRRGERGERGERGKEEKRKRGRGEEGSRRREKGMEVVGEEASFSLYHKRLLVYLLSFTTFIHIPLPCLSLMEIIILLSLLKQGSH